MAHTNCHLVAIFGGSVSCGQLRAYTHSTSLDFADSDPRNNRGLDTIYRLAKQTVGTLVQRQTILSSRSGLVYLFLGNYEWDVLRVN